MKPKIILWRTILFGIHLAVSLSVGSTAVAEENSPTIDWIEDAAGTITFDEIRSPAMVDQWQKSSRGGLNFGFTDSVYWLKMPLENPTAKDTLMLLEIAFALIDHIEVYFVDGQTVVTRFHSGDRLPFNSRPVSHRNFLFPHMLAPGQEISVFIRVQSTDCIQVPVNLWQADEFFAADQRELLVLGVFFGFLAIMLIYNLFLYFSTRDRSYLYYVVFVLSIIHVQISQKGIGFQFFWPEKTFWNHVNLPFSLFIAIKACFLFVQGFLRLNRKDHGWIALAVSGGLWGSLICAAASFFLPYEKIILVAAGMGQAMALLLMYVGINLWIKGNRSARFLTVAWAAFLSGVIVFALNRLGVIPRTLLSENAMLIGSALEAVLISLALADRINQERDARLKAQEGALESERLAGDAQKKALVIQKEANERLEVKVKERTVELESAMQELARANIQLNDLARLDGLTGVHNRRYFDERLESEWRLSRRKQEPLSLLLVDIDRFKSINDTHGHLEGDNCLIRLSDTLKQNTKRPSDIVARYGGEEFAIILPNTDQQGAGVVAERIRCAAEELRMRCNGKALRLTVSIGVATLIPGREISCEDLIGRADQALYEAKKCGRNRVAAAGDPIRLVHQKTGAAG